MMTGSAGGNSTDDYAVLKQSAEAGDVNAQYALGLAFQHGADGIKAYRPSAISWYFKAAAQGHREAQARLGAIFLEEAAKRQNASDAEKARSWLTKAAAQGHPEAMFHLGLLLNQGHGLAQKSKGARGWFEAAANTGHIGALNQLGLLATEAGDHAAAVKYFAQGAEKGDADSQFSLGRCLEEGIGVGRDSAQAALMYRNAAEQELPEAQFRLGLMLLQGKGVQRSTREGQRWLQQAATRGNPDAQFEAAEGFRLGRGSPVDFGRAIAFFRMAADQGHVGAQFGLGAMFESGAGLREPKLPEAAGMYRRAAMGGHRGAAHNFGIMLSRGLGVKADRKLACKVLEYAISLGADDAMLALGYQLMNDGDLVAAAQWTFLVLQREPEGPAQKLLDELKSHLPPEALVDAEQRAKRWERKPITIDWG